jgi:hypothetical protein
MSLVLKAFLISLVVITGVPAGYVAYQALLSPDNWIYQGSSPANWRDGGVQGAPGPIAGGTSVIVIGGAFWLLAVPPEAGLRDAFVASCESSRS